jgi:methionine-rich copper-binding protein CopC
MRNLTILEAAKHLQPHPEEPAKRASRRMATDTVEQAAILRDARKSALLRMRSALFCMLAALLPLLLCIDLSVGAAHAHAFLDHADPRVGNTVKSPPRAVALWFTQNLESAFSTIEVLDANGARMNAGNASVDASDRKLLRVPVKVLPAGTYTVKWHVLSVDTHTTEGNFTFHVAP